MGNFHYASNNIITPKPIQKNVSSKWYDISGRNRGVLVKKIQIYNIFSLCEWVTFYQRSRGLMAKWVLTYGDQGKMVPVLQMTFSRSSFQWKLYISVQISMKIIRNGPIYNILALVQIMAYHRAIAKPWSEPMMACASTHICITRSQGLNYAKYQSRLSQTLSMKNAHLTFSCISNEVQGLAIELYRHPHIKWLDWHLVIS